MDGRKSDNDITVFKSVGIALEDLMSSHFIYRKLIDNKAKGLWTNSLSS